MAEYTDDYGFLKLGPGDSLSTDNYKFGTTDREEMARLIRIGAETHKHNGAVADTSGPDVGARSLSLTHHTDAGGIPAGVRSFYRFTLVDANGFESAPSDPVFIDTPAPITNPAAPTLSTVNTGGALLPGNYYYAVTAWTDTNTLETKNGASAYISVPAGTTTNTITVTLPTLPTGADGFNVYRKKPGGVRYDYVATVTGSGPTFVDNGSIEEDCNRTFPVANYTNMQNRIVVTLGGDPLPAGVTWRLYRTHAEGDYINSRIATGLTGTEYDDRGGIGNGSLPSGSIEIVSPSKILLTDGEEVQGSIPPIMVPYRVILDWAFPGLLEVQSGTWVWRCQYDQMIIEVVALNLGVDSVPASTDIIVDVNKFDTQLATPVWDTIFTTQANRPTIPVGESFGDDAVPDVVTLTKGDCLTVDLVQIGGGATPTDYDLAVQIIGWGYVANPLSVVFP